MRDEFSFCKQEAHCHPKETKRQQTAHGQLLYDILPWTTSEDLGPENPMLPPAFVADNSWGSASTEQKPEPVMSSRIGRWEKKKLQWLNWERKRWTKCWRGWVRTEQPEPGDKTVGSFVVGAKRFPSHLWRDVLSPRRQWQRREPFRPMSPRFTVIFVRSRSPAVLAGSLWVTLMLTDTYVNPLKRNEGLPGWLSG